MMLRLPGSNGRKRRQDSAESGVRFGSVLASATPDIDLGTGINFGEEIAAAANTNYGLGEEYAIERPGIDGRSVYFLLKDGNRVGVRKVSKITTERAGHFSATQHELMIYNQLSRHAGFSDHVVPFMSGGKTATLVYIDFGLVAGNTLHNLTPSHKKASLILAATANSLRWLATAGYSHGDIKADNVYVTEEGKVLLLDFGLARRITPVSANQDRRAFVAMAIPYLNHAQQMALDMLLRATPIGGDNVGFYTAAAQLLYRSSGRRKTRKTGRKSRKPRRR